MPVDKIPPFPGCLSVRTGLSIFMSSNLHNLLLTWRRAIYGAVLGLKLQNRSPRKYRKFPLPYRGPGVERAASCHSCAYGGLTPWRRWTGKGFCLQGAVRDDYLKSTVREILMCKSERNHLAVRFLFGLGCFSLWNERVDALWDSLCKCGKPQALESPGRANTWIYFSPTLISSSFNSFPYFLWNIFFSLLPLLWVPIKPNVHTHTTSTITTQTIACTVNRNQMSQ